MKLSMFNESELILLLGEGNFSFSAALCELYPRLRIIASCYKSEVTQETGKKNIEYLINNGVRVIFDVDVTKLMNHSILKNHSFDKIIFNFPHVGGKMNIKKNRELLKLFFINIENLVKPNGCVLVTLCQGQGGTPMDNPKRRWDDSWKVVEMAAHGNFILVAVEPFHSSAFPSYNVTGYRSLEKPFHTINALIHIFKKSLPPNVRSMAVDCQVNFEREGIYFADWQSILKRAINISKFNSDICIYPVEFKFDVTISINKDFSLLKLLEVLYNNAVYVIHDVELIDHFVSQRKETRTFRITYKSRTVPLYKKRVIEIHQNYISQVLESNLEVKVC